MLDGVKRRITEQLSYLKTTNLYKQIFLSPEGKEVLKDLAMHCNYDNTSFNKDPYRMAFEEGRRSVVLDILNRLAYTLEDILDDELLEEDKNV